MQHSVRCSQEGHAFQHSKILLSAMLGDPCGLRATSMVQITDADAQILRYLTRVQYDFTGIVSRNPCTCTCTIL